MASAGDFLFGTKPSSKVESKTLQSPEQEEMLRQLIEFLGEYSMGSGLGNLESTSLAGLERFAEEGAAGGSQLFQSGSDALQRIMGSSGEDFEQFYQTSIKEPLLQEFEEDVMPRISRQFGASGFFGSDRRAADRGARDDLLSALVRGKSQTRLGARQQELQAAGIIPGFETARGQVGLSSAQAGLDERRKRLAQILGSLGIKPIENIATVTPGSEGALSSFLGSTGGSALAAKGIGKLAALSDRRLKTDIQRVGKLDNGLPVYLYRFKGSETTQLGVMADEVEELIPDAVVIAPNGMKAVHYDMLGD